MASALRSFTLILGIIAPILSLTEAAALTNYPRATYWQPTASTTWQIKLSSALTNTSPNVAVFDFDMVDNSASTISTLHSQGKKVICYFSAGSYENWRPDAGSFTTADYGKPVVGWAGEWWLNTKSTNVRNIMLKRLDLAAQKGCDGVDPDNVDGYNNDTGFNLQPADLVDYMNFLANAAHSRNLAIGLKNSLAIIPQVIGNMQWAVNEECLVYTECSQLQPFISANKPVFHIEYPSDAPNPSTSTKSSICGDPTRSGFKTLLKNSNLDDWYYACP